MKKIFSALFVALLLVIAFSSPSTTFAASGPYGQSHIVKSISHVSALTVKPLSCPTPFSNTTVNATGSTPAHVSMTIWRDCSGNFFASANSFRDSNGFAFTGTVSIVNGNGVFFTTHCFSAGICDSPHISGAQGILESNYFTNNGQFFFLNGVNIGAFNSFGSTF